MNAGDYLEHKRSHKVYRIEYIQPLQPGYVRLSLQLLRKATQKPVLTSRITHVKIKLNGPPLVDYHQIRYDPELRHWMRIA